FAEFKDDLKFTWVAGRDGGDRILTSERGAAKRPRLLGPLNYNSPNRIQLIGKAENRLVSSADALDPDRFEYSLQESCELIIVTDKATPPESIIALATETSIPLFVTSLTYSELIRTLRYRLTQMLAESEIIHGVLMDVHGTGVLITGEASVGKSELALELVSRSHILVADDAPEFRRIAPGTVEGRCPPILQDFLEVRGLGVLNIARMYGDAHTRSRKILRFIVNLRNVQATDFEVSLDDIVGERLGAPDAPRDVLVAPGRNLAVLVEAAVRDYILRSGGYNATRDLVEKQAQALTQS
ncbi:UNVERIFIED_CONTAM: hypothetical protein GTU68_004866, partial [Idotea baltica]|nr:hypothetical protein [Idotea baltica]